MARMKIKCKVNGKIKTLEAAPMARLLDILRDDLNLTGTKEGCGEGECGACSVIIDGKVVNSCLIPLCQVAGSDIKTVESLAKGKNLTRMQKAFTEWGGSQCGICTPGFLMATEAFVAKKKKGKISEDQMREALAGNLCRCTGYTKIFLSIKKALGAGRSS